MTRLNRPPADVPTLTDIVFSVPGDDFADAGATANNSLSPTLQEEVVKQVVRRMEGLLAERLREAAEQLVRLHLDLLVAPLRTEIEQAVRESVAQAFVDKTK